MSELVVSSSRSTRGQFVCSETCVDEVDIERHDRAIARALSTGQQYEGTDTRHMHRRFFGNEDL